jgi:hypothetical protein
LGGGGFRIQHGGGFHLATFKDANHFLIYRGRITSEPVLDHQFVLGFDQFLFHGHALIVERRSCGASEQQLNQGGHHREARKRGQYAEKYGKRF